jgi:hypothetical protein
MNKLTKKQQELYNNLKENGTLYVGYNSPALMNSFNKLVDKGYATVKQETSGKEYTAI